MIIFYKKKNYFDYFNIFFLILFFCKSKTNNCKYLNQLIKCFIRLKEFKILHDQFILKAKY